MWPSICAATRSLKELSTSVSWWASPGAVEENSYAEFESVFTWAAPLELSPKTMDEALYF